MIIISILGITQYLIAFVLFLGIINKIWKKASKNEELSAIRSRVDWVAYEAEVANLRSEAISRKLSELETEIVRIKEYLATALEVSIELDRKLSNRVTIDKEITNRLSETYQEERNGTKEAPLAGNKLSSTEEQVIKLLSLSKGMIVRDLQTKLNMSREHISRLLSRLVDKGIVLRVRRGRQFVYQLQQQNLVDKNDLS